MMGRPKKDIDPRKVKALASIGCTDKEIAVVMDCSHDTLTRRFAYQLEMGRASMKQSLRRMQLKAARNGVPGILIWLGKQYLEQKDKTEVESKVEMSSTVRIAEDDNWYGNANRLLAARNGTPSPSPAVGSAIQGCALRPAMGQNGNGTNGHSKGPRP
jgi:hypothetical protein